MSEKKTVIFDNTEQEDAPKKKHEVDQVVGAMPEYFYNKKGEKLVCLAEGCKRMRPRGAALCEACCKTIKQENDKRHRSHLKE